jgi:hypothetical protein
VPWDGKPTHRWSGTNPNHDRGPGDMDNSSGLAAAVSLALAIPTGCVSASATGPRAARAARLS